ncbi:RHS repeat-associated core domain-containing protein [Kitasatospora sp. NPDC094019]|uniref:RHS repeat-associated core domain-containing protein n=1 Tax=Kitasatospora sp. NPDC094019 TaxID=3364091 RepID=UPI003806CAC7
MSSMSSFFTQAGSFGSAVSGGVDPRTGLFNVRIELGNPVGNRNLGPSFPLTLGYSPLTSADVGLGQGVSLGLTTFDRAARLLSLSSGEQYKVLETDTDVFLMQKKLDTVRVTKDDDSYRVVHKSGDVEILTGPDNGFDLKVPTALITPAGHSLTLTWDFGNGPLPRLQEVRDESDTLLTVEYADDVKATLNVLPDRSEGFRVELRFQNDLLAEVLFVGPGVDEPLAWSLSAEPMGPDGLWGSWITGVSAPGGMSETVAYRQDESGHRFPDSAGLPALPCVERYVRAPGGGQPQIEVAYDYTDTNFLGGYSGAAWDPDQDTLYGIMSDYSYGSTESVTCGGSTTTTTRSYNSYHLLTDETTGRDGSSRNVRTDYYAAVGLPFDEQDERFQLPSTRTVTWTGPTGATRSEVTLTGFDEAGNPLSRTDPDGTRTDWEYYPTEGSGTDCPPDPYGFSRWLKGVTRTPPSTGFDAPVQRTSYSYTACSTPDARVPTAVLKSSERRYADDRLLQRDDFAHSTSGAEFGRLTGLDEAEFPDGEGGGSYTASQTFDFRTDGEELVQTHTLTTHDRLTVTRSQRRSRFTGRLRSATDPQGNVVATAYDGLGRPLTRTTGPGTAYEATESWSYEIGTSAPFVVTSTDVLGNQQRASFDGAGRPVLGERRDTDGGGGWCTVQRTAYDEQGRTSSTTAADHLPGGGGQVVDLTQTYTYDDWGQVSGSACSDGTGRIAATDPVALTTTVRHLGGGLPVTGTWVTTHDLRGDPVAVERFDLRGASAGRRVLERDGWGRVRRATDEAGNTTSYDYDAYGRPTRTTLPDGTVTARGYAPFSSDSLATGLSVGEVPYGKQEFDGLGRSTTASSGGRTWSYQYSRDSDPLPAVVTVPDGQQIAFTFVPELDNAVSAVRAGSVTQALGHDPRSGVLTSAQEGEVTITREYTTAGLPRTETTARSGHSDAAASWSFTLGGLEYDYVGVDGSARRTTRDVHGRVTAVTDPAVRVLPSYDSAGRATGWTAEDQQSGYTLTTALTFDDFGREVLRATSDNLGGTWSLVQHWQDNDLLSRRTFSDGGNPLRDETFGYDSRNRLATYACDGPAPPTDVDGNEVVGQTFAYDAFGNVTQCRSRFTDGSGTATYLFENPSDPCQLTGIHRTGGKGPSRTDLGYDAAGRLTTDDAGRGLGYDALGRLRSAGPASRYGYDPLNRLLTQEAGGSTDVRYYRGEALAAVVEDDRPGRLVQLAGGTYVAQVRGGSTGLLATDGTGTVRLAAGADGREQYVFTPHGQRPPGATGSLLGFTGQPCDPVTGAHHLGNGTRAYNPAILRFNTPDTLSPFGAGGVNPYLYCEGDPVNRIDPSGHLSWQAWLGIGLGIAGLALTVVTGGMAIAAAGGVMAAIGAASATTLVVGALGVASDVTAIVGGALESASPKASSILGWVSLGTGAAGLAAGGLGFARTAAGRAPALSGGAARGLGLSEEAGGSSAGVLARSSGPEMLGRPMIRPGRRIWSFQSVENARGERVWVSQDPVNGTMVEDVARDALKRGKRVHVLSGTHGDPLGARTVRHTEYGFFVEDLGRTPRTLRRAPNRPLRTTWANQVYVHNTPDLTIDRIGEILNSDPGCEVIVGFCFSRNDDLVREFLGLEATYSYVPRRPGAPR